MYRRSILILVAALSVAIVMALPLYLKFGVYPAYEDFLVKNVEEEMKVLAIQMVKDHQFLVPFTQNTPLPAEFIKNVEYIQRTVGLSKIKIFSKEGAIVYSTDPGDVGSMTTKDFFPEMLIDGLPRTELKPFNNTGQKDSIDIIETYVPIVEHGTAVGAFEIYRNISGLRLTFHRMILDEQKVLLPVIILLLAVSLISSYLAYKSIDELKQTKDEFQQLSVTDTLTGLLNRRGFIAQVEMQLSLLQRYEKGALLLYIDMDDFKLINDNYGHNVGDHALIEAVGILKSTLRSSDVIGRIGGDEFAALVVDVENDTNEEIIRQRLLDNLVSWNRLKTVEYTLSFSIGFFEYPPDSSISFEELMIHADENMYIEKQCKKFSQPTYLQPA